MKRCSLLIAAVSMTTASIFWPRASFSHETLTTTVLFDREIVRILNKHCVMCHVEDGPSFPLATYEQTWLQGRKIRASVIARHMPPWGAVAGYGQFINDNSLTLRETQFIVSWVEGLGPRNAGTVFTNVASADTRRAEVRARPEFNHWHLGEPTLKLRLPAYTVEPTQSSEVVRAVVDLGLTTERRARAVEFMPGDRRAVRAAVFTIQETGQWIGSWTPWYGFSSLPDGVTYRLPAGSHIVADIQYRGVPERVAEGGIVGVFLADVASTSVAADLVLTARHQATNGGKAEEARAETALNGDTFVMALRPEIVVGLQSIEVSARKPNGGTEVVLFAKDFPMEWPTPYILKEPLLLPRGTILSLRGRFAPGAAAARDSSVTITVSAFSKAARASPRK